jgi:hypothetical protein
VSGEFKIKKIKLKISDAVVMPPFGGTRFSFTNLETGPLC